jgi:hypothetical protein
MSLTVLSLAVNDLIIPALAVINLIIPAQESLVSDIQAGDGKTANLFYSLRGFSV